MPEARSVIEAPNGPEVWAALLDRLSPTLTDLDPPAPVDGYEDVVAAVTSPGAHLCGRIEVIARTGVWEGDRYASPSEARQAVVTAAAAAGWTLPDLAVRVEQGRWPGLTGLYARYSNRNRRAALARDFRKAHAFLSREKIAGALPGDLVVSAGIGSGATAADLPLSRREADEALALHEASTGAVEAIAYDESWFDILVQRVRTAAGAGRRPSGATLDALRATTRRTPRITSRHCAHGWTPRATSSTPACAWRCIPTRSDTASARSPSWRGWT
jgi:hypothetical protein